MAADGGDVGAAADAVADVVGGGGAVAVVTPVVAAVVAGDCDGDADGELGAVDRQDRIHLNFSAMEVVPAGTC